MSRSMRLGERTICLKNAHGLLYAGLESECGIGVQWEEARSQILIKLWSWRDTKGQGECGKLIRLLVKTLFRL